MRRGTCERLLTSANDRSRAGRVVLSPIAIEVVRRIDALFDIERPINGKTAEQRGFVRQELSKPLVDELHVYLREQRAKLSRGDDLAKAIDYILKRWAAFTLFLDDGRVCLSNNAAERTLRAWLWGENHGCSADLTEGVTVLPPCTASSSRQR